MEVPEFSYAGLELCGYRQLQKMAKSMGLPSNVKKVNLIEMILAKQYSSPAELDVVVNRVKLDRLKVSQNRRSTRNSKRAQASEITSTSKHSPMSPSILMTPKHPGYIIQYSPDTTQSVIRYRPIKSYPVKKPRTSDRILRSYNTKTPRPDYAMMDDLTLDVNSPYNTKNSSFNTKNSSFNTKNSRYNTNLIRPTTSNTPSFNTKLARDYATMNYNNSESSYNTKIVKTNLNTKLLKPNCAITERRRSIMGQSSSVASYNAKIMKPTLKTELLRPSSSKVGPRYAIMDRNDLITKVVRGQNSMRTIPRIEVRRESSSLCVFNEEIMLPVGPPTKTSSPIPARRKRTVSGIYPIETQENNYYECVQTVDFRHTDGKITKINALIQKPRPSYPNITVQDVINRKIERQIFKTSNNEPTDKITKAIEYKPITATKEKFSSISKENTKKIRRSLDLSTDCSEKTHNTREYLNFSMNYAENQQTRDFSTNFPDNTSSGEVFDLSPDCTNNTKPIREGFDLSTDCINNTQPTRQIVDLTKDRTNNTQTGRQIFDLSSDCTDNTQPIRQVFDYSTNCTQISQPTNSAFIFSSNCTTNTQPAPQILDFSTNRIQNTRQFNNFSITCIQNTWPIRQLLDSSSTPTYTNVVIKEMPDNGNISVYYHNKIRSEQIRHSCNEQNEVLPHISEVFSRFNEVQYRNLTQPLYIQVSQESERFPHYPMLLNNPESGSMLESLYNFKQHLIVNEPLLKLTSITNTKCVFSADTVVSAGVHPTPMYNNEPSYPQAETFNSNVETETRFYDYMRGRYQRDFSCDEVLSPTCSSIGTTNSQELGANVTIPEMVEDALELISQDGDYMERIGMEANVQCIMSDCTWIGSQLVYEYHIRQAHQNDISHKENPEWSISLTLGSLASHQTWLNHVVQYNDQLYIISVKYCEDSIMVALMTLEEPNQQSKRGKITIYNKISGKPFTWEDRIPYLLETMPYHCTEHIKIGTADLDLLPNSANLKLINNELKTNDTKVVIGQPSLNDIEIVFYVKIFD